MTKKRVLTSWLALSFAGSVLGQKRDVAEVGRQLSIVGRQVVQTESGRFKLPVKCDSAGNVYVRLGVSGLGPIRKIDVNGKQAITVAPGLDVRWRRFGYFDVDPGGALH
jgi:hypothetical protein